MMDDLWPDFTNIQKIKTPVNILKEQGAMLGEKTKNLVFGATEKSEPEPIIVEGKWQEVSFAYNFYIEAPALQNYKYKLFSIGHDIYLYPVYILNLDEDVKEEVFLGRELAFASTEQDFKEFLMKIFNSKKAIKIIKAIMTQLL